MITKEAVNIFYSVFTLVEGIIVVESLNFSCRTVRSLPPLFASMIRDPSTILVKGKNYRQSRDYYYLWSEKIFNTIVSILLHRCLL